MSAELITYSGDRRLVLGAAEAIRKPVYGDDWNKIRIGLQCSFSGVAANVTGSPRLAVGVCNGSTNVLLSATSDHVVCYRQNAATLTNAGVNPAYYLGTGTAAFQSYMRVGAVETTLTSATATRYWSNNTATRTGFFWELDKTTGVCTIATPTATSAATSDLSDAEFKSIMELASIADVGTVKTNYNSANSSAAFAIDEGANGELDHLFVYWERTSVLFTFNLRHRKLS